ncbi:hypothetical protein M23134_01603 [Microscilla marina ATCC 23134]|uniref:Uncharacterized protein n=1 Tax=Microscilla marina ATCC 23134 TaxID=313606 RepID=A1ZTM0_MICM2|nr:hypothetical protein M23134_01603 [Microscilla marina ATCC 23134]
MTLATFVKFINTQDIKSPRRLSKPIFQQKKGPPYNVKRLPGFAPLPLPSLNDSNNAREAIRTQQYFKPYISLRLSITSIV